MSGNSSLDRETFRQLLASAFAVQENQTIGQSLSPVMDIPRLVATGNLDIDAAMQQIVDSARSVANATGVAIGLLEGDQLIYRAGSGGSVSHIGRRVAASLTVSADTKATGEILRVEDAETDRRIGAAICRQFGAKSLLILPIYRARALAGVLEVLFGEAHVYQDREVRTYRWMTRQFEAAMLQAAQLEEKMEPTAELLTTGRSVAQTSPQRENVLNDPEPLPVLPAQPSIYQGRRASLAIAREWLVFKRPALLATMILQRAENAVRHGGRRTLAMAAVAAVVLLGWIAYSARRPASPLGSSARARSTAIEKQVQLQPVNATLVKAASRVQAMPVRLKEARPARAALRRVWSGEYVVDYIGEDVTVRHFIRKPAPQPRRVGENRVTYIGEDVTVRYFAPKPAGSSDSR